MNNNNNTTEPCPYCGSHLTPTHAIGCPNGQTEWIYKNGMQMSQRNAELLMELAGVLNEKGIQS